MTTKRSEPVQLGEAVRTSNNRDIVVVGASAGGVNALVEALAQLPATFPAAVFIAVHIGSSYASNLSELLKSRASLPSMQALHGEQIRRGHIYVAPPDNHLLVRPGYMQVVRGPKENGHRPSVDALFRTASASYGPRVIGVVLSGGSDCGTIGLTSIKTRAGIAVVQDPHEAVVREMPESALRHVKIDHVLPAAQIGPLLQQLAAERSEPWPEHLSRTIMELEGDEPGASAHVVCPICHGRMTQSEVSGLLQYRCHVGHAFSMRSMALEQAEELERALWAAVRSLEESATFAHDLALRSSGEARARLEEKERAQAQNALLIHDMIRRGTLLSVADRFEEPSEVPSD